MTDEQKTPMNEKPLNDPPLNEAPEDAETVIGDAPKAKRSAQGSSKVEWAFDFAQIGEGIRDFFNSLAGDEEVIISEFTDERQANVQALRVNVDFSLGRGTLQALPIGGDLFHATVKHVGEMEFLTSGIETRRITLRQRKPTNIAAPIQQGFRAIASRDDLTWQVGVAPDVPVALEIDGGVGPVDVDLTGMRVRSLDIDSGVGSMMVTLPSQAEAIRAELDSGVGETHVTVPAGVHGEIDIEGGVGQIVVIVSPNAAVRVRARNGLGSINVPHHLHKVKDHVWQSDGYELAERKLVINYEGGVGSFNLRTAEVV